MQLEIKCHTGLLKLIYTQNTDIITAYLWERKGCKSTGTTFMGTLTSYTSTKSTISKGQDIMLVFISWYFDYS